MNSEQDKLIEKLEKINKNLTEQNQLLGEIKQNISQNSKKQEHLLKKVIVSDSFYRLNNKVFNNRRDPLFSENINIFDHGIIATGYSESNASLAGKLYSTYSDSINIGNNYYAAFHFNNPSDSSITAQFTCVFGKVKQTMILNVFKDVTSFSKSGDDLTPRNNNPAFSDSSGLTVEKAFNVATDPVSGGTLLYVCIEEQPFFMDLKGGLTLPPDHNLVISFKNEGGATDTAAFDVRWWEVET